MLASCGVSEYRAPEKADTRDLYPPEGLELGFGQSLAPQLGWVFPIQRHGGSFFWHCGNGFTSSRGPIPSASFGASPNYL